MSGDDVAMKRRQVGRGDKRGAILAAAFLTFARDGYTRASIDVIAAEAGVSTRTIYNHFQDKAQLFQIVMHESANRVADAQISAMDRHLNKITDLEADLIRFAREWVTPMPDFEEHFALLRQIRAEAGHIPKEAIDAWREAGPLRVLRELARHISLWTEQKRLRVDNADRAANHFSRLISLPGNPSYSGRVPSEDEIEEIVTSGVRVFLYGYLR